MQKLKSMQFNALARTPHTFHYAAHLNQLDLHSHLLSSYPQTDTITEIIRVYLKLIKLTLSGLWTIFTSKDTPENLFHPPTMLTISIIKHTQMLRHLVYFPAYNYYAVIRSFLFSYNCPSIRQTGCCHTHINKCNSLDYTMY